MHKCDGLADCCKHVLNFCHHDSYFASMAFCSPGPFLRHGYGKEFRHLVPHPSNILESITKLRKLTFDVLGCLSILFRARRTKARIAASKIETPSNVSLCIEVPRIFHSSARALKLCDSPGRATWVGSLHVVHANLRAS